MPEIVLFEARRDLFHKRVNDIDDKALMIAIQ